MSNKPIVLSDLDDTQFQTLRKLAHMDQDALRPAALNKDSVPLSFMTPYQSHMFEWLNATTEIIPVTARGMDSVNRIQLPFHSYLVAAHGAVIQNPDKTINTQWHEMIVGEITAFREQFIALQSCMQKIIDDYEKVHGKTFRFRPISEAGHDLYLLCKVVDQDNESALDMLEKQVKEAASLEGWYVHSNRNNLAFLPAFVNKKRAVQHVLDNLLEVGDRPILGMGDSVSDLPFMELTHMMCIPPQSQIVSVTNMKNLHEDEA